MSGAPIVSATLDELNAARTAPAAYAAHIRPVLAEFDGLVRKRPGKPGLRTSEGAAAVEEAIKFLETADPCPKLEGTPKGMCAAAGEHCADLAKSGLTGHEGSDGSSPFDRLERHGEWQVTAGENIAYASADASSAREYICQLIIDDGVPPSLPIVSPSSHKSSRRPGALEE